MEWTCLKKRSISMSARCRGGSLARKVPGVLEKMLRGEARTFCVSTMVVESNASSALTRSTGSLGSRGSGNRSEMDRIPNVAPGR